MFDVLDITFLVPAKVRFQTEFGEQECLVQVDLMTRKVYENSRPWDEEKVEAFFRKIDDDTSLPEDLFVDRSDGPTVAQHLEELPEDPDAFAEAFSSEEEEKYESEDEFLDEEEELYE